jgi:5-methylcytosine-specific restriction endonuclease McrA
MIIDQRRCAKCGCTKAIDLFGRDKSRKDGLACWCKDCLNANSRKYHEANRDKYVERHRRWYSENPPNRAVVSERTRIWRASNPEHARMLTKNGKHRRRARTQGGLTASDLRAWLIAQPKVCHWCGVQCKQCEIDHIVPLSRGGKHERSNLTIACPTCNRKKGARCPVEFAQSIGRSA